MPATIPDQPVPTAPEVRRAWIRLELTKRGRTLSSLKTKRCSYSAIRKAITAAGHQSAERLLARALGLKPEIIWPERFDSRGLRIKKKPGRKPRAALHMEKAA